MKLLLFYSQSFDNATLQLKTNSPFFKCREKNTAYALTDNRNAHKPCTVKMVKQSQRIIRASLERPTQF